MFINVDVKLTRNGMTRGDLAKALNLTPSTVSLKLNGKAILTLNEAKKIKQILKTNIPLEDLFDTQFAPNNNQKYTLTS